MILKSLRTQFKEELEDFFPESEIESFFNLLCEFHFKLSRIDIALNLYMSIPSKKNDKFQSALKQLKHYKPIQYVLGETEFYGLKFKVDESVLIPRPETEELIQWILTDHQDSQGISILDIGTGSGCIAVTLAHYLKNAEVFALDVSAEAIKIAKTNAKLNVVDLTFVESDIFSEELSLEGNSFDIIVSNPPYVRQSEKQLMKSNVLDYEPHLALFVDDEDPLQFYKRIVNMSASLLKTNGKLYFEINENLGSSTELLLKTKFNVVELRQDINGKNRMIKGIKV